MCRPKAILDWQKFGDFANLKYTKMTRISAEYFVISYKLVFLVAYILLMLLWLGGFKRSALSSALDELF